MIPDDVARGILIGYLAMAVMAARGFQLRTAAGREAFWPDLWAPAFLALAVLLGIYAVLLANPYLCVVTGVLLHLLVIGRIIATQVNENVSGVIVPGGSLTATAFYGTVLLSSSIVWRYLLWPHTRTRR